MRIAVPIPEFAKKSVAVVTSASEYIENAVSGEGSFGEEAGLKGAQFIQDIAQYFQEGWSSADYDTMIDLFASGQAAIMYNGTWALDQADMIVRTKTLKIILDTSLCQHIQMQM